MYVILYDSIDLIYHVYGNVINFVVVLLLKGASEVLRARMVKRNSTGLMIIVDII